MRFLMVFMAALCNFLGAYEALWRGDGGRGLSLVVAGLIFMVYVCLFDIDKRLKSLDLSRLSDEMLAVRTEVVSDVVERIIESREDVIRTILGLDDLKKPKTYGPIEKFIVGEDGERISLIGAPTPFPTSTAAAPPRYVRGKKKPLNKRRAKR